MKLNSKLIRKNYKANSINNNKKKKKCRWVYCGGKRHPLHCGGDPERIRTDKKPPHENNIVFL